MPSLRFEGFEPGEPVSIRLANAAATVAGTIAAWRNPPVAGPDPEWEGPIGQRLLTVNVTAITSAAPNVAPLDVTFDVRVTGSRFVRPAAFSDFDPTFCGIHYVILTGDTGFYDQPWYSHQSHIDKRYQYGQLSTHVYSTPGTYTARVYAYDEDGKWGVSEPIQITVADPDVAYLPARTIVISNVPGETWAGAPPHDVANRCTTIQQAFTRFNSLKWGGPVRVCARGGTYAENVTTVPDFRNGLGRALFDTWEGTGVCLYDEQAAGGGSPLEPLFSLGQDSYPFALKRWHFKFGYDPDADGPASGTWGVLAAGAGKRYLFSTADGVGNRRAEYRVVLDQVKVTHCMNAIYNGLEPSRSTDPSQWGFMIMNECLFEDNGEYLAFNFTNVVMLGCQVKERYGVCLGYMGRSRVGGMQRGAKGHRFLREPDGYSYYMRGNFLEQRGGWSGQNSGRTLYAPQPLTRMGVLKVGKRVHWVGNVILGEFNLDSGAVNANGVHAVLEANTIFGNPAAYDGNRALVENASGRKAIRNNQFVILDVPEVRAANLTTRNRSKFEVNTTSWRAGVLEQMIEVGSQNLNVGLPLDILHNSFLNFRTPAMVATRAQPWGTANIGLYAAAIGHNLDHAPEYGVSVPGGFTPANVPYRVLDVWMRMRWERQTFTLPAPVAPGQSTPVIPYPNDWNNNPTTQASYAGTTGLNDLRLQDLSTEDDMSDESFAQHDAPSGNGTSRYLDAIEVTFGPTGFTVQNTSALTWPAGPVTIMLDRGDTCMEPDLLQAVPQTHVKVHKPVNAQPLTPGVKSTLFDFTFALRPNAGFAISPTTGQNAAGPILPASLV